VTAHAFVSGPLAALPAEVAPTEKYMKALREGAGDNYLDPLHQVGVGGCWREGWGRGAGGKLGGGGGGAAGGRGGHLPGPNR
jgi:hypothetical protein